jgi:hypothetical protein
VSAQFIVSIKAFGDFVIACHSLRKASRPSAAGTDLKVLAGEHLWDLARALHVEQHVQLLPSGPICPPIFDIRKRGLLRAAKSMRGLREQFQSLPRDCALLFDHLSWRENLISTPLRRMSLLPSSNIYLAFEETLIAAGFELESLSSLEFNDAPGRLSGSPMTVAIFPSSRIAAKCLPKETISGIVEQASKFGFESEVIGIRDESVDLPRGVKARFIERRFECLISAIKSSDLVVSADSLAAHLAEYCGVPSFVVSPRRNSYWLPLSAHRTDAWCLFGESQKIGAWLERQVQHRCRAGF